MARVVPHLRRVAAIVLLAASAVSVLTAAYLAGVYLPAATQSASPVLPRDYAAMYVDRLQALHLDTAVEVITGVRARGDPRDVERLGAVVDTLHRLVLGYVAARMNLSADEEAFVLSAYAAQEKSVSLDYARLLAPTNERAVASAVEPVVSYQAYNSVNDFVGVLSGHVCGLVHFPGQAMLRRARGLVGRERMERAVGGDVSCRDVLDDALAPFVRALRRQAVIRDLNTSRLTIESHVRSLIAELATAEERIRAEFSDEYVTRVLFLKSSASVQAEVYATAKAGFDLNKGVTLEIDHDRRRLSIYLPAPEILSTEIDVRFIDVDNGMFVSIDAAKYNAAMERARNLVQERLVASGLLGAARRNADHVVRSLFQPVLALPQFAYEVDVVFPGEPARAAVAVTTEGP